MITLQVRNLELVKLIKCAREGACNVFFNFVFFCAATFCAARTHRFLKSYSLFAGKPASVFDCDSSSDDESFSGTFD